MNITSASKFRVEAIHLRNTCVTYLIELAYIYNISSLDDSILLAYSPSGVEGGGSVKCRRLGTVQGLNHVHARCRTMRRWPIAISVTTPRAETLCYVRSVTGRAAERCRDGQSRSVKG